jgi:hypothetical protein
MLSVLFTNVLCKCLQGMHIYVKIAFKVLFVSRFWPVNRSHHNIVSLLAFRFGWSVTDVSPSMLSCLFLIK